MADNVGVYNLTSGVDQGSVASGTLDRSGSVNFKKRQQRDLYNRKLLGTALRSEIGQAADTDPANSTPYSQQTATIPTWTNISTGKNHAFVIQPLSSSLLSHHQVVNNCYFSGTYIIDPASPVPVTGTVFYEKQTRLVRLVYKLSASDTLPSLPGNINSPSVHEYGTRALGGNSFYPVSGSYRSNHIWDPSVFEINVPDYGIIKDVKVWVEFIHDHRSGVNATTGSVFLAGTTGSAQSDYSHGLQSVVMALRSPNVTFPYAHPLWNAPQLKGRVKRSASKRKDSKNGQVAYPIWEANGVVPILPYEDHGSDGISGSDVIFQNTQSQVPDIFRNSYLLWSGHAAEYDLYDVFGGRFTSTGQITATNIPHPYYAEFDKDIDMRTIFSDMSPNLNPRNITDLGGDLTEMTVLTNYKFPMNGAYYKFGYNINPYVTGSNFPWFLDTRVPPGIMTTLGSYSNFYPNEEFLNLTPTSTLPPSGWLNGPGGNTPDVNEFNTFGMSIGPNTIQPVYPLLEDVYVRKSQPRVNAFVDYANAAYTGSNYKESNFFVAPADSIDQSVFPEITKIEGFRPGLKGTEINGKWKLLIGVTADYLSGSVATPKITPRPRGGIWFRQFRLEFIVEQGKPANLSSNSTSRKYKKSTYVPRGFSDRRPKMLIYGSAEWDIGTNQVFVSDKQEYGRTIGITDQIASSPDKFAVFSRITGTLADIINANSSSTVYDTFLNNEFGTPYIPLSAGSGFGPSIFAMSEDEAAITKAVFNDVLRQQPILKQSNTLKSVIKRNNFLQSTLSKRSEIIGNFASILSSFSSVSGSTGTSPDSSGGESGGGIFGGGAGGKGGGGDH